MAKNTIPATETLNEEDYINKLYDGARDKQKQLLMDAYTGNQETLDTEQQRVQQQTDTNVQRTDVEAQKLTEAYSPRNTSDNITAQAELAMGNQQRKNVGTLREVQSEADYEIERQRQLLGQQYAEAIKKAQAENDLARAQQLYEEAKAKEAEFQTMRANAGKLMAEKGDNSILEALAAGTSSAPGSSGETADAVLRNEDVINGIYDSANEINRSESQMVLNAMLSRLQADRDAKMRETDRNLTDVYVNALRQGKNYDEVQNASGLGSGNMAQARLARMLGTTEDMTALRGDQMGTDAGLGQQEVGAYQVFRDAVQQGADTNEQKRIAALLSAAKGEEQNMANAQMQLAQTMAQQGDYSLLGKLYGLTQDQIDRLQGTGVYAPKRTYTPAPIEEEEEEAQPEATPAQKQLMEAYEKRVEQAPVLEPWLDLVPEPGKITNDNVNYVSEEQFEKNRKQREREELIEAALKIFRNSKKDTTSAS